MAGEGVALDYVLAERLHRTVAEVASMPNVEYETWSHYLEVQSVLAELRQRTEANRARG